MSDAVSIAQYTVGVRTGAQTCPTDLASGRLLPAADISGDGVVSIADAVIVIQCIVGIDKRLLPRMNTA